MVFTEEATQLFLNGGKVVNTIGTEKMVVIVRMPKGEFIQDEREGQEDNKFEYVILQNYDPKKLTVVGWKNGSLSQVKKRVYEEELHFVYGKEF